MVGGPPAVGKSTLGSACALAFGAALLDQDVLTGPLTAVVADLLHTDDLDSPRLAEATRHARYESIVATAVDNLRCRTPVVLVAPFTRERSEPARWQVLRDRLVEAGARPHLVVPWLPAGELLERLRTRAAARDRAKLTDPAAFLRQHQAQPPGVPHVSVDARWDLQRQVDWVRTQLFVGPTGSPGSHLDPRSSEHGRF